ncbi:MAG: hypothetical protein EXS68_00585 [Candidatus Ryanbacteria bacterium]|nr:hypothetical protein [Candidatus Ryanbacteria bacterium]
MEIPKNPNEELGESQEAAPRLEVGATVRVPRNNGEYIEEGWRVLGYNPDNDTYSVLKVTSIEGTDNAKFEKKAVRRAELESLN